MKRGPGKVVLAGGGPGDPGLITLNALNALRAADVVLYDRLVNPDILAHASQARLVSVGKTRDQPGRTCKTQQEKIIQRLIRYARRGFLVVRLKGGDPFVFGRGGEEAIALHAAGINFEIIPGVSSLQSVPASAGIPITHRGVASSFSVFTGHDADQTGDGIPFELAAASPTAIFLMGVQKLPRIVSGLIQAGRSPSTPVAVIENGTTPRERIYSGTLADIESIAADAHAPAIIVVGDVVKLRELIRGSSGATDFYPETQTNHARIPDLHP